MTYLICTLAARRYWVDRLDPFLLHIHGGIGIRWYGAAYLAGILAAAWFLSRWARSGRIPIDSNDVSTFLLWAAVGIVLGGRLGYCLFCNARMVLHHPQEIFAVWHGGMASHGGLLGLLAATTLFARTRKVNSLVLMDAVAATAPIGIALGRVANFINGELWGRPSTIAWAVIFPQAPMVNGVEVPRHPSQMYAAGIEGVLVFVITQYVFRKNWRPGAAAATFFAAYGIGRFLDEFWRQPDVGQPVYWGWISKGQILTLPMIVIGTIWLFCVSRARSPRGKGEVPRPLCVGSSPARAANAQSRESEME